MKKGLLVLGSMLFVAAMAISCGNKNVEAPEEEIIAEEEVTKDTTLEIKTVRNGGYVAILKPVQK